MKSQLSILYSTYARAIIGELAALAQVIHKYSTTSFEQLASLEFPIVLTLTQFEQALLNPQNSIKSSIHTYATIIKLRREASNIKELNKKQRSLLQQGISKLREKLKTAANDMERDDIMESIQVMEKSIKDLSAANKEVTQLEIQAKKFEQQLITLIKQHDQEWEQYRGHYLKELLIGLEAQSVELSELETNDLLRLETWSELIQRFEILNLEIPNYLNLQEPKINTYFKLKAYLAIHASLSRRMLPSKPENILKLLKKLPNK